MPGGVQVARVVFPRTARPISQPGQDELVLEHTLRVLALNGQCVLTLAGRGLGRQRI